MLSRNPLVQFAILGALLFAALSFFAPERDENDAIVVSAGEVSQLLEMFSMQWNRPPTDAERDRLIDEYVREEVFYREAVAMGLDENDRVIRRRLAQRIEFLAEDLANQAEPVEAELASWFEDNHERYRAAGRVGFTQVYVSPDKRGAAVEEEALAILTELRRDGGGEAPELLGDALMLPSEWQDTSLGDVASRFGGEFAEGIADLELDRWDGPVASGYGLHLVRVHTREDAKLPPLSDVREAVLQDFRAEKRREANDALYDRLREQYRVEIEQPSPENP